MNRPRETKSRGASQRRTAAFKPAAQTPAICRRPDTGRWFIGTWGGISALVVIAGLATGKVWQALGLITIVSVPVGTLWLMLAARELEPSTGSLADAEAALTRRPPTYPSDSGNMPGCSGLFGGSDGGGGD